MTWTIELPVPLPSGNEVKRQLQYGRKGWYGRLRGTLATAVMVQSRHVPKATGHRLVTVTRVTGPRGKSYDLDNLAIGAKPLIDELVAHGLLVDDDEEHATISYQQRKGEKAGTVVEVSDG